MTQLEPEIAELLRKPTLFVGELARVLRCSRDTVDRRRKRRTLPRELRELPAIDGRPRFSTASVLRFLELKEVNGNG